MVVNKLVKICILTLILVFTISFINATDLQFEWGNFTVSPESWQTITLQNSYVSPIIVATPEYSSTTRDRGIGVWLRNVTDKSFEIIASNHQADALVNVKVNYMVVEEGNWTLPNSGTLIEAGQISTNKVGFSGTGNWECPVHGSQIFFAQNFNSNPVVFSTRATNNNNAWAVTFNNNLEDETQTINESGMCLGLSQANAPSPSPITNYETIYWVAMDEVHDTLNGIEFEALWQARDSGTDGGNWINGYDDGRPHQQDWATVFSSNPIGALVSQTTNRAGEGGWPILHSTTTSRIRMFIDENIDRSHTKSESGGGFGFTGPIAFGNLPPNSSNLTISPQITWATNDIQIQTNVEDPQTIVTIKNVTATIKYPDNTKGNFSFSNSPASSKSTNTGDLESSSYSLSVPPDESIWLDDWNFRKKFTITGSTVSNVENYTMRINVYNKEGFDVGNNIYTGGKAKMDYSDIRFTNSLANSSGILPYWIERLATDHAIIWIKFDFITQSPDNDTFYIYYNNSAATYQGNGAETFLFFEDFESYSSTPDDVRPPGWLDYNSGTVLLDTDGSNRVLKKTANNDPSGGRRHLGLNFSNYELIWKTNRINNNGGPINRYGVSDENANGYSTYSSSFGNNMRFRLERRDTGSATDVTPGADLIFATQFNTWYYMKLNRYEGRFKHYFMDLTETVFDFVDITENTHSNFNTLYIHGGQEYWSDDFLLRKYIDPEPLISSWEEEEKWKNAIEGETNYISYSYVDNSNLQGLTNIQVNININDYSSLGSDQNSNTYPMLDIELSKGDNLDWEKIGTIIPAGVGSYSISTTNVNLLESWKFKKNRNIRLRAINMDNFDTSNIDVIGWDDLNVSINSVEVSDNWFLTFNDTNQTGFYNVTNIITCDKGDLCTDKIYSNASFEISDKGNLTLHTPSDNQKFFGTNQINFTWDVRSSFTNNTCFLFVDSILINTVNCTSGVNVSQIINVTDQGLHTWNVESQDGFNVTSFSDVYSFYIIYNKSIKGEKSISAINQDMYLIRTVFNRYNSNRTFSFLDKTPVGFIGGSWSIFYNLLQIVDSGLSKLYRWDFDADLQELNYSYSHTPTDYEARELYRIGLE